MKKSTAFLLAALTMALGVIIGLFCVPGGSRSKESRYFDDDDEEIEDLYGC